VQAVGYWLTLPICAGGDDNGQNSVSWRVVSSAFLVDQIHIEFHINAIFFRWIFSIKCEREVWGCDMITVDDLAERQFRIFDALKRRHSDLKRYAYTIRSVRSLNVAEDQEYQRTFNGLYMVRRNALWRSKFFALLEACKTNGDPEFSTVLDQVFRETGRIEASFASKLVATIDPGLPVYDSIVRINLGLPQRSSHSSGRIELLMADYATIQDHSMEQTQSHKFRDLRRTFDDSFPEFRDFSDTKVLDLMIWQVR
jgi:hypothetical protein